MISCPLCGARTRVYETRASANSARRRRICMVSGCDGKVTTVEVVVPDRRASGLASGSILVSAVVIRKLRELIASIEGGVV